MKSYLKMDNLGWIEIICGPMFSGKTEELIKRAEEEMNKNNKVLIFKPDVDNRYSKDYIVTHNKKKLRCITINSSIKILKYKDNADIFCIDEAQFFNNHIIQTCIELANLKKNIILAGLDKDFEAKPFGKMAELLSISDYIKKLNAICKVCGKHASFSQRISNDKQQVLVGESENYEARCRNCHTI